MLFRADGRCCSWDSGFTKSICTNIVLFLASYVVLILFTVFPWMRVSTHLFRLFISDVPGSFFKMAPPKKKVVKHLKKSWKKHSDIQDVEEYLEEKRQEERTGGLVAEKKDDQLFFVDAAPDVAAKTAHYGTKPGQFETSKIHFPTSEGVSGVSAAEGASKTSSPEQANELAVRANERTDEQVAQYLRLYSCLFQTTVHRSLPSTKPFSL